MAETTRANYWDYIEVERLLDLQGGLERDESTLGNDEVLFITVHQVYELWFKLVLREMRAARDLFCAPKVDEQELSGATRSLNRISTVLRLCTDHFQVMETLTTREYLSFRDKLTGASGFQSAQLRQIEILMGLEDKDRIPLGIQGDYMHALKAQDGSASWAQRVVAEQQADMPTLKGALEEWLLRTPIDGPFQAGEDDARVAGFVERYLAAHAALVDDAFERSRKVAPGEADVERLRQRFEGEKTAVRGFLQPDQEQGGARVARVRVAMVFIETYSELPLLAWPREILDALVELEQLFVIWRQRHARMVERVIGRRTGTGGSAGVDYLDRTALAYRVFEDLWTVRTLQIPRAAAPTLENPSFYDFQSEV